MISERKSLACNIAQRLMRSASYRLARARLGMTATLQNGMHRAMQRIPGALDTDLLYAVYDLNAMPTSYDIVWFLAAADIERRRRGLSGIHVIISLFDRPFVHAMPLGHEDHVDETDMLWRVENILVPCCSLLPTCVSHSVMPSAMAAARLLSQVRHYWPADWSSPSNRPCLTQIYNMTVSGLVGEKGGGPLRASEQGRRYIRNWARQIAGDRDLIVITLRHHHGGPARNSDLLSWIAFADGLDQTRFHAVFVPDTLDALSSSVSHHGGHTVLAAAAHNTGLRLALYEEAYLNLFVSNGPAYLAVLDGTSRYLMFKILVSGLHITSAEHLAAQGFPQGLTPDFSKKFQKWVWEDDHAAVIQREFRTMSERIDTARNSEASTG